MLYPIRNEFRSFIDLSGFWKFKIDKDNLGETNKWSLGFESEHEIAVPGSWNEQLEELGLINYIGTAWFELKFFVPAEYQNRRIVLRFGSVDYNSKVWLNGTLLGVNNQGFLPFEFDVTNVLVPGKEATIVVKANNELSDESIPQGIKSEYYREENRLRDETFPPSRFDFLPFGGIHRPVKLYTTGGKFISGIKINSKILGKGKAKVSVHCRISETAEFKLSPDANVECEVLGNGLKASAAMNLSGGSASLLLELDDCRYWSPKDPFLYSVKIRLFDAGRPIDEYSISTGIREVRIQGNEFLLNNERVFFRGFGKHEDFAVVGKGLFLPQIVKDFELIKWTGANSFRTSHYPYSEEIMSYADRKGILVIDEVPAVSLDFRRVNQNTLNNHKDCLSRLVERDFNHPCVVMWAAGNEPNLVGEDSYYNGSGKKYWSEVISHLRSLDKSRPVTVPNCTRAGLMDPVFEFVDVISINRYYGWYEYPGDLDCAISKLSEEMDELNRMYNKPLFMTEFGTDTVPGLHSTSLQMFTEEYQTEILKRYIETIESKNYTIGEHVWNFADFRTPQHFRRVVLNLKGVFSRSREPKNAAFMLRELWNK